MRIGKRGWVDIGWFTGNHFVLFGIQLFENTGGDKGDWCFFHLQIAKFVIAFGRWRR